MANAGDEESSLTTDLMLCSICLEQYKLPVSLPCSHSFCLTCLSKHIITSCVKCDPPLGFPCPLCRKFIPAPGKINEHSVDRWAKLFPENKLLALIATGTNSIYCKSCQEDDEESKASSWCMDCSEVLCDDCVKCHKKVRLTRNHVVVAITECSASFHQSLSLDKCETHGGRKLEIICKEHLLPCCSVCVTKEHDGCKTFCQLEDVDANTVGPHNVKNLQAEVETMCSNLEQIITDEKTNMSCLDNASDKFAKELSGITTSIIATIKKLEEKHLDETAKLIKESKSKLENSVQSLEHRLSYLQYWKEKLTKNVSNETILKTNEILSYIKMKHIYESMGNLDYPKLEISIQTEILDSVQKLTSLSCLAKTTSREKSKQCAINQRIVDLKCAYVVNVSEFTIKNCNLHDGEFLSRDKLLLTGYKNKRCVLCNTDGVVLQEIPLPGNPWGMCMHVGNEVLVTLPLSQKVVVLDANSLEIKQSVHIDRRCFGISTSGNTAVIGARDSVLMFDNFLDKNICRPLATKTKYADDVALGGDGNIIFTNYSENVLNTFDKSGKMLFKYSHEELKSPYGLTVDGHGNIFVCGGTSNNIHIVSNDGKTLRILKGVQNPLCIKFLRGTNRFFVGEEDGRVKVFELQNS
uniref:Tripartite motif-containing protein 56 n=4 Tax=Magallana gigas TaxID=29159 RepID=A0A8W8I2L5_MAGGI|nr:E3 ubiquitin-protein ligase TRIM71 isoform X1 [Crassostrea gigas]XP_034325601.1 E3 ubiquitin-protein ligase TRIM71 isoform X2 [Crassostrea gigas]